jgi:carbon monoxide dehydrogenase subunit G
MELQGSVTIPAPLDKVWDGLNDPEILRRCIPGCEQVEQVASDELHARVLLKMGPVRARFAGKVKMTDVRPQQGYTLNFEGSGGSAGFARGSSVITLQALGDATRLDYTAQASVAGKLGQIGGRLMDASARQLADKFFEAFKGVLTGDQPPAAPVLVAQGSDAAVVQTRPTSAVPVFAPAAAATPSASGWVAQEAPRLLWFCMGAAATGLGVWMGAHWLR